MAGVSITVDTSDFEKMLKELVDDIEAADDELKQLAIDTADGAKARAPVRSGRLRNSINHTREGEGSFVVEADTDYAAHVEFGTSKQAAQPYMRPALNVALQRFEQRLKKRFDS